MKITIRTISILIFAMILSSCHRGKPVKELEHDVAVTFRKKTGWDVSKVSLIKVADNKYEGTIEYIMYGNFLHKNIRVTTDMDDPNKFNMVWQGELWE